MQQSVLQPSGQALATSQPRGPTPPRPAAPTVGLLQKAEALIRSGKEAAVADPQLRKFTEISFAGRGLVAHKEMNVAIQSTMPKDRASPSYTQVPPTTLDGGDFGELEHYRAAFNAADFGISDGQDRLGPGAMSVVGLPPLNTSSDTYLGLGYRMFNLKATMLDFDHGLEVNDPNHPLLHAYLLFVGAVYLPHQSPRSGWSKVLLDPDLESNGLRAPSPRVSGGTPGNSVLILLFLLPIFSVQCPHPVQSLSQVIIRAQGLDRRV